MTRRHSMSIEYDENAEEVFDMLKELFGVRTKVAVIQRSLAVARSVVKYADENGIVHIDDPNSGDRVALVLR